MRQEPRVGAAVSVSGRSPGSQNCSTMESGPGGGSAGASQKHKVLVIKPNR